VQQALNNTTLPAYARSPSPRSSGYFLNGDVPIAYVNIKTMTDTFIKPEAFIKPDPETLGASPTTFTDEDIYEDAGDLDFNTNPDYRNLYLARVPKYVWEAWSELDDDAEIQIGTIRTSQAMDKDGNPVMNKDGSQRERLQMLLFSNLAQHQTVPKEYELDLTSEDVKNTFIFTEQDLPGYKSKSKAPFNAATANIPAKLHRAKMENKASDRQPWDKTKRFQPYFKKAIPKKTTISGKVTREMNCVAVENAESERILARRTLEAMKPKVGTKFISEDVSTVTNGFIQPGTDQKTGFDGIIRNAKPKTGKKGQDTKTTRMPRNELLDRIFKCFRQWNYWSMASFRAELKQPEAYIRETLDTIADLAKSGPYAMKWTLKPENKLANSEDAIDTVAPESTVGLEDNDESDLGDVEGEDDDDENVKMEDVLPS